MSKRIPKDIDAYVAGFPKHVRQRLQHLRRAIRKAAPQAEETISYRMAALTFLDRNLVYFAAHTSHIGFYPGAGAVAAFAKQLAAYKRAKGSIQFPFDRPLPVALVGRIVKFRVKQNRARKKNK
jgi:uncharacterized protein YdhG (YjbR/CyaY superfamily)